MGLAEGAGNSAGWLEENPFTTGGAVVGTAYGGPIGGLAGGGVGSMVDRSVNPSDHEKFMETTGVADPAMFQEHKSSYGLQPGDTTGLDGITDYTQRGAGEQAAEQVGDWSPEYSQDAWGRAQSYFGDQSRTATYADRAMAEMPTEAPTTRYAEQEYLGFERPNLQQTAGLDPYYDNAKRRTAESIDQSSAARGSFASSQTQGMLNEAYTNLEAEKANREADYGLDVSAEQRAWEGLGGQLASSADASARGETGAQMDWLTGQSNVASAADVTERARNLDLISTALDMDQRQAEQFMRELEAGFTEQTLGQNRSQALLNNTMGMSSAADSILGPAYDQTISTDEQLMQDTLEWETGIAALGRDESKRNSDKIFRDLQAGYDVAKDQGWFGLKSGA